MDVIDLESSSRFSFRVNPRDKLQHNIGISQTCMKANHNEEALREQRQDNQSMDQISGEQRAGKHSNLAANYRPYHINNNASVVHVHDNVMGKLDGMTS